MAALWKWSALAAALYGLIAVAAMLGPPRAQKHPPPLPGLGGKPGHGGVPGSRIDFEEPGMAARSISPSLTDRISLDDGNHILRWTFPAFQQAASSLVLPLPPAKQARALHFAASASRELTLMLMLREDDGSLFMAELQLRPKMREIAVPLREFSLFSRSSDENNKPDAAQIVELSLLHKRVRIPGENRTTRLIIELDNIELR